MGVTIYIVNRAKSNFGIMKGIEGYWRIDDFIKSQWGDACYNHIDYCGLEPIRPMKNFGYFCTPINTLTFAATGGDGVHFGFLKLSDKIPNDGPVVMTVPMSGDVHNVIVAENFIEFLSLGYYVGWFSVEQIVYNLDEAISYFSKQDDEISEEESNFLKMIHKEYSIKHFPLSKVRLEHLKSKYFNLLEFESGDSSEIR